MKLYFIAILVALNLSSIQSLAAGSRVYDCSNNQNPNPEFNALFTRVIVDKNGPNIILIQASVAADEKERLPVYIRDSYFTPAINKKVDQDTVKDQVLVETFFKGTGISNSSILLESDQSIRYPNDYTYPFTNSYVGLSSNSDKTVSLFGVNINHKHFDAVSLDPKIMQLEHCVPIKTGSNKLSPLDHMVILENMKIVVKKHEIKSFLDSTSVDDVGGDILTIFRTLTAMGKNVVIQTLDTKMLKQIDGIKKWPIRKMLVIMVNDGNMLLIFTPKGEYLTWALPYQPRLG